MFLIQSAKSDDCNIVAMSEHVEKSSSEMDSGSLQSNGMDFSFHSDAIDSSFQSKVDSPFLSDASDSSFNSSTSSRKSKSNKIPSKRNKEFVSKRTKDPSKSKVKKNKKKRSNGRRKNKDLSLAPTKAKLQDKDEPFEGLSDGINRTLSTFASIFPSSDISTDIDVSFPSSSTVGSPKFLKGVLSKLEPHRNSLCLVTDAEGTNSGLFESEAAISPEDMRCLALVSHNEMKATMKEFVVTHKDILKKFRLTGTNTTMTMIREVFADEPGVVFGPTCSSGPLGGDAELVGMMTRGQLGGILFFQDPMSAHPHQCDIDCLVRQAQVHNTLIATTPTTALALVEVFRLALEGPGRAELLPSFFFSLQSPTVRAYKSSQATRAKRLSSQSSI